MDGKKKGFWVTCKDYFGILPEQGFADEMAEVPFSFKQEIFSYFQQIGMICDAPVEKVS